MDQKTFRELYEEIEKHGPIRMYYTGQDANGDPVNEVVDVQTANYNTAQKVTAKYAKSQGRTHLRLHDFRFRSFDVFDPEPIKLEPSDWLTN